MPRLNDRNGCAFFVVQWLLILAVTKRPFSASNLPFAASGNPAPGVIGYGQVRPQPALPGRPVKGNNAAKTVIPPSVRSTDDASTAESILQRKTLFDFCWRTPDISEFLFHHKIIDTRCVQNSETDAQLFREHRINNQPAYISGQQRIQVTRVACSIAGKNKQRGQQENNYYDNPDITQRVKHVHRQANR